jgi:hypothetical protein
MAYCLLDVSVGDFDFIKLHVLAEMTWREALSLASREGAHDEAILQDQA